MEPKSGLPGDDGGSPWRRRGSPAEDQELEPLPKKRNLGKQEQESAAAGDGSQPESMTYPASQPSKPTRELVGCRPSAQAPKPWLVHVSSTPLDGTKALRFSGTVIQWDNNRAWILTSYRAVFCTIDERLYDPKPKLAVHVPKAAHLPNNGIFDADIFVVNRVYQFTVLTIKVESMLEMEVPTHGRSPLYGDEVSALALDEKMSMMLRRGTITWLEEDHFVFFSSKLRPCGIGGPLINHDGEVIGMACDDNRQPSVVGISIIQKCVEIWANFGRFARPRLGMCFRTVELLDLKRQFQLRSKYGIKNGFIVDEVVYQSTAEKYGVRRGDVITSFNGMSCYLPEFEDFLLSVAVASLNGKQVNGFKLEVHNLLQQAKRTIILPVEISDGSEM
ncbi:hypothetical protein ACP70R_041346 [Stipagrostis hirtigluma subsp. patula]